MENKIFTDQEINSINYIPKMVHSSQFVFNGIERKTFFL